MKDCCCCNNLTAFKIEINQILGRLFSQYYNITFLSLVDIDGNIVDFQMHKIGQTEDKKKLIEVLKKTIDFKIDDSLKDRKVSKKEKNILIALIIIINVIAVILC